MGRRMGGSMDRWTDGRLDAMHIEVRESGCSYVSTKFYVYMFI